jgi:diguanylate cyclase (GGDEF)-like protein
MPVVDSLDELLETVEDALGRLAAQAIVPQSPLSIARPAATPSEQGIGTVEDGVRSVAADLANVTRVRIREARELRRRMYLDPVTGLANRAAFEDHFAQALAGHRGELTVLMVDADNFKAVNDRGGHASGDDALRRVGEIMADQLRPGDFICRYGGDEFAALLSDASPAEATEVAERLRAAIEAGSHLTISVGIAVCGRDLRAALLSADQALYAAKARGRNRVRYASGPDERAPLPPPGR